MQSEIPILRVKVKRGPAEICVSFTHRVSLENYGGPRYESVEFFSSRKVQCSPEDLDALAEELREEVVDEAETRARQYVIDMRRRQKSRAETAEFDQRVERGA